MNHPVTYFTEKSNKAEIPIIFPTSKIAGKEYVNFSEKKRLEKVTDQFMKLRQYIIHDELNEKTYIKEFMMKHGIYDDDLYSIDKLTNFANFLFTGLDSIDPSKTFKEIVVQACNYDPEHPKEKETPKKEFKKKFLKTAVTKQDFSVNFNSLNNTILDKKINSDFRNRKALINRLEIELAGVNCENELPPVLKSEKSMKVLELDLGHSYQKKKVKIDLARKKNKLLEFVVLERSKNAIY
jgi:hypothetical protein